MQASAQETCGAQHGIPTVRLAVNCNSWAKGDEGIVLLDV
jgi:hypothetical protein